MKKVLLVLLILLAACGFGADGVHSFAVGEESFLLDGKPFVIRAGEMHLARVAPEYWRHRLQMLRACGFNAVGAYLFWNYHEREEGVFDFASPDHDVVRFCRLAQEEGLWVILRPGPYVCAEWDSGGLPWWLQTRVGIRLRSRDPKFLEPARRYLAEVGKVLAPLQITRGGPILMVQAENEYGSYGDDKAYMREIHDALRAAGFEVPLFACNGFYALERGAIPELLPVVNFGYDPARSFAELRKLAPKGPLMCGEYYPAWFDSWGQVHHVKDASEILRDLDWMLQRKASFSMYMAHGGTTFGWWAGCNAPFAPEVSSYDFDAPVSEAGWAHPVKFAALRDLFAKHLNEGETIPEPPAAIPMQKGECEIVAEVAEPCAIAVPLSLRDPTPKTLEKTGVGYGVAVYHATLPEGVGGLLKADVRDLGIVRLGGKEIGYLDRRYPKEGLEIVAADHSRKLEIVVEPMGRYNFGELLHQGAKGIVGDVTVGGAKVTGWFSYGVRWDDLPHVSFRAPKADERIGKGRLPACRLYRFKAKMAGGKDTFFDMSGWKRGMVWLNGHALGRYWSIGPTQTCYAPGCWIKDGDNEIVVWDAVGAEPKDGRFRWLDKPVLDVIVRDNDYYERPRHEPRIGIDAWKGAKVAFLGDSITDPIHVGCKKNYWNFLIEDLGLDAKVYGVNGDTWNGIPNQIGRIHESMDDDLDAIFVFIGTNDYMGGVPLGEMFDVKEEETNLWGKTTKLKRRYFNRDSNTYYGRVNIALDRLKSEFPDAQIVLLTPVHRAFFTCSETNVQPPECFANAAGRFIDEYVDATKEAAKHWSVPVIDLFGESGLLPMNDSYIKYFANSKRDRLHPNTAGHRRLADLIEAKLNALPASFRGF